MVGSEQVSYSPVSPYGGSNPEVVNENSENLNAWYISCYPVARNEILTATPEYLCAGVIAMIISCE